MPPAVLPALALGASVAGTGYQVYQGMQASKAAAHQGQMDALLQGQRSLIEGTLQMGAAKIAMAQERAKRDFLAKQAASLRQDANALDKTSAEEAVGMRIDGSRLMASQEAATAASGLSMVGTPVAIAIETARNIQADIADNRHQRERQRVSILNDANAADAAITASSMESLNQKAAYIGGKFRVRGASIMAGTARLQGAMEASRYKSGAIGAGLSGLGNAAYMGFQAQQSGAFGNTRSLS